jgi:Organic solute transporter Ostalpha
MEADVRLGYRFYRSSTYYEFARDAYEAFVICSFMILMCNFLGSELESKFSAKKRQGLIFPLCCIKVNPSSWVCLILTKLTKVLSGNDKMVHWFERVLILGAFCSLPSSIVCQYEIPLTLALVSIIAIILETQHLLCPESFSLAFGNSWLQIIKAISVTIATYFLIEFYYIIHKDIAYGLKFCVNFSQYKPLLKFIGIKLGIALSSFANISYHFDVLPILYSLLCSHLIQWSSKSLLGST